MQETPDLSIYLR